MMGTYFILMSLLSLYGLSRGQDCRGGLLKNVDFQRGDIITLYAADTEHCQYLCTQHPSCQFFTFIRADWTYDKRNFYCYLKKSPSGQPIVKKPGVPGITSGFSLKGCNPDPKPCLSRVYRDVDFTGADIRQTFASDYSACQRVCTQDYACQFFTYVEKSYALRDIRYKCFLKFSWTVPRMSRVVAMAGVVSGYSNKLEMGHHYNTECEVKLFPNVNIPGFDTVTMPAVSAEHCLALCSAYPRCTYFSYVRTNFKCYLKYNTYKMKFVPDTKVISGLPARFCWLDAWVKKSYVGVNLPGSNIRYLKADNSDMCHRACSEDPNCQFYSYFTDKFRSAALRRRCYLKRSITIPAPPRVKKVPQLVSGFSLKNCN